METLFKKAQTLMLLAALAGSFAFVTGDLVKAQSDLEGLGPSESCTIHRDISIGDETYVAGDTVDSSVPEWGLVCFINTLNRIVDIFVFVLVFIAVIMIVIGAFTYMTSAGEEEKTKKGRDYLLYALIGIIVAAFARMLPNLVSFMIGIG